MQINTTETFESTLEISNTELISNKTIEEKEQTTLTPEIIESTLKISNTN